MQSMLEEALLAGQLEHRPVFGGAGIDQLASLEALQLGGLAPHERERKF
jgi:hypothetical protein